MVAFVNPYFLKIKYTANIRKPNPIRWLILNVSFLKNISENAVNTINVIASWITFNCQSVNGPPFSTNPILFAGTWAEYSKRAMPQLIKITEIKFRLLNHANCLNFKWPYQAVVIKIFDKMSNAIV